MAIRRLVSKYSSANVNTYVGRTTGELFHEEGSPDDLRVTDGTPGGRPVSSGGSGGPTEQMELETTGPWSTTVRVTSVPAGVISFYPANVHFSNPGAWIENLYFEEDTSYGIFSASFPNLVGVVNDFQVEYFIDLVTLDLPELVAVGDYFQLYSLASCTELNMPNLEAVGGEFQISYFNSLTELSVPKLKYIGDELDMYDNSALETISFPVLEQANRLYINNNPNLNGIYFPEMIIVGDVDIRNNPSVTSVTFDKLERVGQVYMQSECEEVTNFRYGNSLREAREQQRFGSCTLDTTSVDHILVTLAGLDGENGTILFTEGIDIGNNNSIPSVTGFNAIKILESIERDVSISYNYPEAITFSVTAGTSGSNIGLVNNTTGSATNSYIRAELVSFYTNSSEFIVLLDHNQSVYNILSGKSMWIDGVEFNGYFANNDGETITFELNDPDTRPLFVNGQTYQIEIKQ